MEKKVPLYVAALAYVSTMAVVFPLMLTFLTTCSARYRCGPNERILMPSKPQSDLVPVRSHD